MSSPVDIAVVGGGPIGLSCAIEARWRGLSHVVLEKGCLLQSIVDFPITMTFFSTSDRLEIGDIPFASVNPKPTRAEALEYYRRVKEHWNLDVRTYETVEAVKGRAGDFTVTTTAGVHRARYVVLATGFYGCPNRMGVPGEDLPKVSHYYREPFPYAGQRLLVVGGGNSAADAALETWRHGAEVTLAVRGPSLDGTVKYWVLPDIQNRITEGSVRAFFNSSVVRIDEKSVTLQTDRGERAVENDFVLAMTGYHPDFDFLARLGVRCSDDGGRVPVHDETTYESSVPGIYVSGVMCNGTRSGVWLIENSREHARAIFDDIESKI